MGTNALHLKENNTAAVLRALYGRKQATVKELAPLAGLSYATVGGILNSLVESGKALLGEALPSAGGRPSQAYIFNAGYSHVLALSARARGGAHVVSAAATDLYGQVVWQGEQSFSPIRLQSLEALVEACGALVPSLRVLSISLPGVVREGKVLTSDYAQLQGLNLSAHFQEKYRLQALVENDVNAAVLGYGRGLEQSSIAAGLYFPRRFAPGAGIRIGRKILRGAAGYAGEVARLPLAIDWETLNYDDSQAAGPAIARLIQALCAVVNPHRIALYGDFFTPAMQKAIGREISPQTLGELCPALDYHRDLDDDILAGLLGEALGACRQELWGEGW